MDKNTIESPHLRAYRATGAGLAGRKHGALG